MGNHVLTVFCISVSDQNHDGKSSRYRYMQLFICSCVPNDVRNAQSCILLHYKNISKIIVCVAACLHVSPCVYNVWLTTYVAFCSRQVKCFIIQEAIQKIIVVLMTKCTYIPVLTNCLSKSLTDCSVCNNV